MLRFELAYVYDVWSNVPLRGRTLSPRVNLVCALGIGDYGEESRASTALQV